MSEMVTDTGMWRWNKEDWLVVQKKDGSVVCNSDGSFTAASASTWRSWKASGFWNRLPQDEPEGTRE